MSHSTHVGFKLPPSLLGFTALPRSPVQPSGPLLVPSFQSLALGVGHTSAVEDAVNFDVFDALLGWSWAFAIVAIVESADRASVAKFSGFFVVSVEVTGK